MVDRLISRGLSMVVLGLLTMTGGGAIIVAYRGIYELLCGKMTGGAVLLTASLPLGLAARLLMRHKDDLMDK